MDAKKRLELLNNVMSLLCRVDIKGIEGKPAGEAIDFIKVMYDEATAAVLAEHAAANPTEEKVNGEEQVGA